MRHIFLILATATVAIVANPLNVLAQQIAGGQVNVKNVNAKRIANNVNVSMELDVNDMTMSSNRGLVLTPMIVNGSDTAKLKTIEILGRKRYLYYLRNQSSFSREGNIVTRRNNGQQQNISYLTNVPYEKWMNNSQIIMSIGECGCEQTLLGDNTFETMQRIDLVGGWHPMYAYVRPEVDTLKMRDLEGSARLNFVVDKYDIHPTFGNNAYELMKIRNTIDTIRSDKDFKIKRVLLHGYASPDGSYKHNEMLAANRTEALKKYLVNYYDQFSPDMFTATSTAEDWDGVRQYFVDNNVANKDELLKIVDSNLTPDEKERTIAKQYPAFYRTMLNDVYPPLRRTDYVIKYTVRAFNPTEAQRLVKENPQKLSLEEMYSAAMAYETGSDDFCEVFDVAVRMYPDDKLANLNAANVALSRGDKQSATKYLAKAGNSAETQNARGILALLNEDYTAARNYFQSATDAGLTEAKANLEEMAGKGL